MTDKSLIRLFLLAAAFLLPSPLSPQSRVDELVQSLEDLTTLSYDNWRYDACLSEDDSHAISLSQPGHDDSTWQTMKLGESHPLGHCWLRKRIVLPERMLGQPVKGPAKLVLTVDDAGHVWVNGQSRGSFSRNGTVELTTHAQPGDELLVVIKILNAEGSLSLVRADVEMEELEPLRRSIQDVSLSFRVGQKLLSFDTYQTTARLREDPGIDRSELDRTEKKRLSELLQRLATQVDLGALRGGALDRFQASLTRVRPQLQPIDEFAKRFTLVFDANAHIDAAWLWREKETVEVVRKTFESVLNMMGARPDFTYSQSSAAYYDWMERLHPDIFRKIRDRAAEGRWEIVGGMWVEPDCNLPSGESWMRHFLYAKRYFLQRFGTDVRIGWNPDSFGYNWNMPQLFSQAGIDAFITQKIGWNDTNIFPHRVFWWEGPDGSRILAYFPFDYFDAIDDPFRLVDWLRQFEANTGFTKMMVLFGVGDHGGGPSPEMLDRIERLKSLEIYPEIEYGTASRYLEWLGKQDISSLPSWKDELYLEYHQGTFTTQAKNKRLNRTSEVLLTNAEKLSAISNLVGARRPNTELEEAWRIILFNQFHDILPGSSIREVYVDSAETYQDAQAIGEHELRESLELLSENIDTSNAGNGTPVTVFNSLSWERTDVVNLRLPEGDQREVAVFDLKGREIPSQTVPVTRHVREILFIAEDVPAMGYKTYVLREQRPSSASSDLHISEDELENEHFKLRVDPASGRLTSILDKRIGREVLNGPGNELQILEDKPAQWDAWNIGLTGAQYPSTFQGMEVAERGPVRAVLRVHRDYLQPGSKKDSPTEDFPSTFFAQDVILYRGLDRLEFRTDVDWWETHTMLKVAFPVAVDSPKAVYEIPFGFIERSTKSDTAWEKARFEVPAIRWADLSAGDYGVSLLNKSKHGYDIKGSVMRLSLLRSPTWPDPTADRGKHSIEYALYPHAGIWKEASTVRRGYEYNYPLIAVRNGIHKGRFPDTHSFVHLEPRNLVLTTLKTAEDSEAWVLQWYETRGEETEAVLRLPEVPQRVFLSNFLEEEGPPIPFDGNVVRVRTKGSSAITIKVYF